MREWRAMLGALLIWTLHFLVVYGIASVADISDPSRHTLWRTVGLAATLLALLALGVTAVWIRRAPDLSPLSRHLGLAGCGLGALAVVWQSLPLVVSG